jgi:hypothetical protein
MGKWYEELEGGEVEEKREERSRKEKEKRERKRKNEVKGKVLFYQHFPFTQMHVSPNRCPWL